MEENTDKPSDQNAETLEPQPQPEHTHGAIPKEIGRYKVRRIIGSGGMGTVYEAIQESPRRKVAIKVMRSGVTSRSAMRRFEYESQILGRLSHPCIAQVYEAGTYDDGTGGVPYFAMEYVVGAKTLLEYSNQKDLNVHDRLDLFGLVCDAVHHGHLKGIIHRDLKPDNILVDSSGNPKIIDFGVARSTDSDMVVTTMQTNVGQLIGTVQYMSPEQCEADPDLIDARSDVYSLGVILYELLTGQPPYDLSSIPIYEATRLIREQQPTKMTTIAEGIEGDLETIVSKSMDKDRDRRYQSSYEIGQDITRFLENEPIHARRASMVYQLKMFARRNKAVVATVCTIAVALVLVTVVSVYAGIRASQAEAKAIVDRDRAIVAEQAVAIERDRAVNAELRATQALLEVEQKNKDLENSYEEIYLKSKMLKELSSFTTEIFSLGAPRNAQGKMLTTHDLAIVATDEITKRFADLPYLELPSRFAMGRLLWELGDLENARVQLERSLEVCASIGLEEHSSDWLNISLAYSKVLLDLGEHREARKIITTVIEKREHLYGSSSAQCLIAKAVLADIMAFTEKESGEVLQLMNEIVDAINDGVDISREFELESKVALAGAMYTSHPVSIEARMNLAGCYMYVNRINDSIPLLETALDDARVVFGPNHLQTAEATTALGIFYYLTGRTRAEELLLEANELIGNKLGNSHPHSVTIRTYLGQLLVSQGRFSEAEIILRDNVKSLTNKEGEQPVTRIQAVGALAYALMMQGKFEEGDPLLQETLLASKESSESVRNLHFIKANSYVLNEHPLSDKVVDDYIATNVEMYGPNDIELLSKCYVLSSSYFKLGKEDRGIELLSYLLHQVRDLPNVSTEDLINVLKFEGALAELCDRAKMPNEVREILERIIPQLLEHFDESDERILRLYSLLEQAKAELAENATE
jgi:tetratricopeptide (TPR) repeat protein